MYIYIDCFPFLPIQISGQLSYTIRALKAYYYYVHKITLFCKRKSGAGVHYFWQLVLFFGFPTFYMKPNVISERKTGKHVISFKKGTRNKTKQKMKNKDI